MDRVRRISVKETSPSESPKHAENRCSDHRFITKGLGTQCVHAGERWEQQNYWPSSTPVHNATTFFYDRTEDLDDRVYQRKPGYFYSRSGSPTHTALERAVSTLEHAGGTHACASGMAASHLALLAAGAGKDALILCASDVYGSVFSMVKDTFPHLGGRSILMGFDDPARLEDVMKREKPDIVYFEVVTNPMVKVIDAPTVIDMAHRHGAKVVVDNTFTTPYLIKPLDLDADFVCHSVSKFLAGHGDVLAGSISCRQNDFNRLHHLLIEVGSTLGPNECWLALRGMKTFELRMERHCANAMEIASYLDGHPKVQRVVYPGLTSHPQADIIRRIFPEGRYGAMLKFDIADCSQDKAFRFLDALELIRPATTLGDVYSLIVYPARTTHRFLSDEEMATLGIGHGTFRMSVGIETADDLKADLEHALGAL